jgi:hypothetical protein
MLRRIGVIGMTAALLSCGGSADTPTTAAAGGGSPAGPVAPGSTSAP